MRNTASTVLIKRKTKKKKTFEEKNINKVTTDLNQQKGEGKCTHTLTNMAHTVDLVGSGMVWRRV